MSSSEGGRKAPRYQRRARCAGCAGRRTRPHDCVGRWHPTDDAGAEVPEVVYACNCPKCQPPVTGLSDLLRF